ncbi:hypothetical protein [Spiroplasma culicicola]|uniref:Uncharacterized protein n=1 Tax=Spiroplasma culicicola AES-1 TaxID=1276246 RepID=W6A7N8_9MOLU|nr:hypothetical protein [Spiroplasma culicicola]AHI53002.1 hypothetical protein SCULI_v1c06610 [Spiroplasma culicicola AES-1]
MIKLLSLIGTIGLGVSNTTPLLSISSYQENINVSDNVDLSVADGHYNIFRKFPYYSVNLKAWAIASEFITGQAANALNSAGHFSDPSDFELVSSYNITDQRDLNDDDLFGRTGARTILVESVLKASQSGEAKGFFGEMKIYTEIVQESLDLSFLNGEEMFRVVIGVNDIESIAKSIHSDIFVFFLNDFELPTFQHVNSVETSKFLFKHGTNELFTQEDLENLEVNELTKLDFWLTPTKEGKERGVYNKAKMTLSYIKTNS